MPTPAQIDEQIKLERDQIAQGLKRLHKNTKQLEEKSYGSATIYGITSIDELLPSLVLNTLSKVILHAIAAAANGSRSGRY